MYVYLSQSFYPTVMAATPKMKAQARKLHSPYLWVKVETEGPMEDRINTGELEGLMQK